MQNVAFGMDKQWGPTIQHMKLCPIYWERTWWKIIYIKKEYIYAHIWLGHWRNIINHLYINKIKKKKGRNQVSGWHPEGYKQEKQGEGKSANKGNLN